MDDKVKTLKKNFENQLEAVTKQIEDATARINQLATVREQLKGAIFALSSLDAPAPKPTVVAVPKPVEVEDAPAEKSALTPDAPVEKSVPTPDAPAEKSAE